MLPEITPYGPDERRAKIEAYLAKRTRRVWKKKVKYACRRRLAEARPRVKGRFVPMAVLEAYRKEMATKAATAAQAAAEANGFGDDAAK